MGQGLGINEGEPVETFNCNVQDSNGRRYRGKTVMADVWNLPIGQRIVVAMNSLKQPIGDEAGALGNFCGTIARNGGLCSLSFTRWDNLKKANNYNNKHMILKEVEQKFLYPECLDLWILKSIGNKWSEHKCFLKAKYYNDDSTITQLHDKCPPDTVQDQWVSLINFWKSDEGKKRSERGRLSQIKAQKKVLHTAGSKSHARVRQEMKERDDKSPTRTALWLATHEHPKNVELTGQVKEINSKQEERGESINLDEDAGAQVIGRDKSLIRGLGLGVSRSDVSSSSVSREKMKNLSTTSRDETMNEYQFCKIMEAMGKLQHQAKKQDRTINKLSKTIIKLKMKIGADDSNSESSSDYSDSLEVEGPCPSTPHDDNCTSDLSSYTSADGDC